MTLPSLSIIIPFHKAHESLSESILKLWNSSYNGVIKEIILCHNGPHLIDLAETELKIKDDSRIRILHTDQPGLGAGCKLGISQAQGDYILITGIDLPFGLSDLDQWSQSHLKDIMIGSKSHPKSRIEGRSFVRLVSSFVFVILKSVILPLKIPADTQGTIFIKTSLAKKALSRCGASGFFFTTELVSIAMAQGASAVEMPVIYPANEGKSSVSPIKDGIIFIKSLFKLRKIITGIQHEKK